jgi:hypothetical protein
MLLALGRSKLYFVFFFPPLGFSNEPVGGRVDAVAVVDGACTVLFRELTRAFTPGCVRSFGRDETALAFQKTPTLPVSLLAKILRKKKERLEVCLA